MEQLHEIIAFDNSIPVKCFLHKLGYSGRHYHDSIELLFILSGKTDLIVEDAVYHLQKEDIVVVNTNEIHELRGENCVLIAIQMKPSLFEGELDQHNTLFFDCNSCTNPNRKTFDPIRQLIAHMVKNNISKRQNFQLLNKAFAYQLIFLLLSQFQSENVSSGTARSHKNIARVEQIIRIINENYASELTLASLAEEVHLSVPYLSRFFDKQLGTTFLNYLNSVRLSHAVNELLSTDLSIEQLALDNGFSSAHSFVQIFKKNYNCLPSVYRRNNQTAGSRRFISNAQQFTSYIEMEQHDYMQELSKYLDGEPALETIPVTSYAEYEIAVPAECRKLIHTWKTFVTVGSARLLLYENVRKILRDIHSRIGYRYIKFHGILSDDMHVCEASSNGNFTYCYTYVDQVLDFLLSIGLKPLIELSFMPAALAADPSKSCFGFITSPPKDMTGWVSLIQDFTGHLIARYGAKEVSSWPFSVWNEPDTNYNMFGFASYDEFYPFYEATYRAVKKVCPAIRLGTPSNYYLTQYQEHWIQGFMEWCEEHGCMPDFYNMHFYATTFSTPLLDTFTEADTANCIHLSDDENLFHSFVTQINNYAVQRDSSPIPIYLTEWNVSPSHMELLNDTCFLSCYIVKNILENYDCLDSFGFWTLTDFLEEFPIPSATFHGGLGLVTYNGIPKASYQAFCLLNRLGDELVAQKDGIFLTRSGETYQLILYNYKHFSSLYAQGEMFDMTPSSRYATFMPEESKEFTVTIQDIPENVYTVTEISISRRSGSSFDKWMEMGGTEPSTPEELETLRSLSVPMLQKYSLRAENGTLKLTTVLEQLEVKLFIFSP